MCLPTYKIYLKEIIVAHLTSTVSFLMLYFKQFFCRTKDGAVSVGQVVSQLSEAVQVLAACVCKTGTLKLLLISKTHIFPNVLSVCSVLCQILKI